MTTLIYDDFTPDVAGVTEDLIDHTPNTGGPWKKEATTGAVRADWGFEAARFWGSNAGCRIDSGESDVKITANFTSSLQNDGTANNVALRTRMDDVETPTNCYEFRFQPSTDTVALYAYVAGTPTQVGSDAAFAFNNNLDYELFVSSIGTAHVLKVNGTQLISETDSSVPTNTYVGLTSKTIAVNGRPAFYDFLAEDTASPGAAEVYPASVEQNEDTAWVASDTTIVGDTSDEDPATNASPSALNKILRLLMGTATAPGAASARIEVNYSEAVGLPEIPLNGAATPEAASETILNIAWDTSTGSTGYKLYLVPPSVASDTVIYTGATNSYQHTTLTPWTNYHYKVAGTNTTGEGEKSVAFSGRTDDIQNPTAPTITSAISSPGGVVTFEITKAVDTASGVSVYDIYNGESLYQQITIPELDDETEEELPIEISIPQTYGVTYNWKMRAIDSAGNVGDFSNIVQTVSLHAGVPSKSGKRGKTRVSGSKSNLKFIG